MFIKSDFGEAERDRYIDMLNHKSNTEMSRISFRAAILVLITISLCACTGGFFGGYGEKGQSLEEFTRYVEQVFKLQNSLTSELMLLQENDEKPHNLDALLRADQIMQTSCAPLNDYAELDSDGLSASLSLKRRVEKSASDCEKAANVVKNLLGTSTTTGSP